jgi:hypothetical protein
MIEVTADRTQNLLRINYSKHVSAEEVKSSIEKGKSLLANAQPGFRLLTDLSGLDSMDVACAVHIRRWMDWCNKQGVAKIVRVIPDPHKDIGLNIMSLFHYRHGIPIVTCENLKEALTILRSA